MMESDAVVRASFEALMSWPAYSVLTTVLDETPDLRAYLAGGVIRDVCLGRHATPKDFDFFLGGPSVDDALVAFKGYGSMQTGPFGSPRWYPDNDPGQYCDLIPIERFYNGLWRCEDIVDALNQFDFTGNAVAIDLRDGRFYDPQNGRRDMQRRIMRMIRFDYPDEPIGPGQSLTRPVVLWFRVLYYARRFGLTIEPLTRNWLIAHQAYREHADTFAETFFPVGEGFEAALGEAIDE